MTCSFKDELLALHAGGDLAVAEAAAVEEHALQCVSCAETLAAYRASRDALMCLREESPMVEPEGLWSEIEARLDVVDAASRHRIPWYSRYRYLMPASVAAALLIGVQFLLPPEGGAGSAGSGAPVANESENLKMGPEATDPVLRPASSEELHQLLFSPAFVGDGQAEGLISQQASADF